jgi:hypothetical protein
MLRFTAKELNVDREYYQRKETDWFMLFKRKCSSILLYRKVDQSYCTSYRFTLMANQVTRTHFV